MYSRKVRFEMGGRKLVKKSDAIIICAVALMAAVYALISGRGKGESAVCRVFYDGRAVETRRLDLNASFRIEEAPGMVFEINDGKVAVIASDCPDKVCVKTGFISRTGQKSVCLPNRVTLSVDGGDADFDAPDMVAQ